MFEKLEIDKIILKYGPKTGREGVEGYMYLFNLGARWGGVNAASRPFYPGKETPVPIVK